MGIIMYPDHTSDLLADLAVKAMMRDLPSMPDRYRKCNDGSSHEYQVIGSGDNDEFRYILFQCEMCGFKFKDPIPNTITTKE